MVRHVLNGVGCVLLVLGPAAAAGPEELPIRKAGLWEIRMLRTGSPLPEMTMQHCTNESTDRQMNGMVGPAAQQSCSKQDIRKTATGYASDTVCNIAGRSITSHSDVTGDFNAAYTVTTTSHSEGGPGGARETTSKLEAKWIGPCKPDQKPGDIVMPGGRKMNVLEMPKPSSGQPTR